MDKQEQLKILLKAMARDSLMLYDSIGIYCDRSSLPGHVLIHKTWMELHPKSWRGRFLLWLNPEKKRRLWDRHRRLKLEQDQIAREDIWRQAEELYYHLNPEAKDKYESRIPIGRN